MSHSKMVETSISIIKDLQERDGGITATKKDDVYPYVYPRDAAFMTMALNSCGDFDASKRLYRFLRGVRRPFGEFHQRYNSGLPYVTNEHELDTTPIVLQGIWDTFEKSADREFLTSMWPLVQECASFTVSCVDPDVGLVHTTNSIHETREVEEGFDIWTNCAAVRGLVDSYRVADAMGAPEAGDPWLSSARKILANTVEKLRDRETGVFVKLRRRSGELVSAADMSQLAPFYFGVCDDDTILAATLEHLRKELWNPSIGGFNRFRDFQVVKDWHWYTGGTNASWPFFTIWAARLYRRLGLTERVGECLSFLESVTTSEHFIPEKVAPVEGYEMWKANELEFGDRLLNGMKKIETNAHSIAAPGYVCWAAPLGWAHAEYVMFEKEDGRRSEVPPALRELVQDPPIVRS